ncbi:MAG: hypothetical protein KC451_15070 [Amylibacter sp.]|nr:hypothetical protein [Amylibacter sp.]
MTEMESSVSNLIELAENASHAERLRLQPKVDSMVTALTLKGLNVPNKLRYINNTLKDEVLDEMFDNMPV